MNIIKKGILVLTMLCGALGSTPALATHEGTWHGGNTARAAICGLIGTITGEASEMACHDLLG